jgi:hypothetical protein
MLRFASQLTIVRLAEAIPGVEVLTTASPQDWGGSLALVGRLRVPADS